MVRYNKHEKNIHQLATPHVVFFQTHKIRRASKEERALFVDILVKLTLCNYKRPLLALSIIS